MQIFRALTEMLKDDLQGLHCLEGGAGLHELVDFFSNMRVTGKR